MTGKIDLHTHTTASDGRLTPSELVELALARGLSLLAVTDHDSTDGVVPAIERAAQTTLEVWSGVELSTDIARGEVHMLGYFVDPAQKDLQDMLEKLRWSRIGRAREMVVKLNELGMNISFARVQEIAGDGAIGRPHLAQALVEGGYVKNSKEAFDKYLGRTGPAYADRFKLSPTDAVRLIRDAGGMPVLAHPMFISQEPGFDLRPFVQELLPFGLVGIECHYANTSSQIVQDLLGIASEFNLIPTGGTDFHGPNVYSTELGDREVPSTTVERMRAWRLANPTPSPSPRSASG